MGEPIKTTIQYGHVGCVIIILYWVYEYDEYDEYEYEYDEYNEYDYDCF